MNRGRKEYRRMNNNNILLDQDYKHANKERLCFHCNQLQEKSGDLKKHKISGRTYMSEFDSMLHPLSLLHK